MAIELRANTARVEPVGPFISSTDGLTPLTSIVGGYGSINCDLYKGATKTDITCQAGAGSGSNRALVSVAAGVWTFTFLSGDTDTPGGLSLFFNSTSGTPEFAPFVEEFEVVAANHYDARCGDGLTYLNANLAAIAGDSGAATILKNVVNLEVAGTVASGTITTTSIPTNLTYTQGELLTDRWMIFRTGALTGSGKQITAYNGSSKTIACNAFPIAPSVGDIFVLA